MTGPSEKKRTQVDDVDRSMYDFVKDESNQEHLEAGLTPEIVREISEKKDEPDWMLELRLKSLDIYNGFPLPTWGPSIDGLDMDHIVTYVKPETDQQASWDDVPEDIKDTSTAWASRRPSAATSPAWARSTTRSSCTTPCRSPPPRWASSTRASRRRCRIPSGRASSTTIS